MAKDGSVGLLGKATAGVLAATALFVALETFLEKGQSFTCRLGVTLPWCESRATSTEEKEPNNAEEKEPNNHVSNATVLTLGKTIRGRVKKRDRDWYKFKTSNQSSEVRVIWRINDMFDTAIMELAVFDAVESKIKSTSAVSSNARRSFVFSTEPNSTYYILVSMFRNWSGGDYELFLSEE